MFHYKFTKEKVYFTGCEHISHKNICRGSSAWSDIDKTRDFDTLEEMNLAIIQSFKVINPTDHLFILGDIIFGDKSKLGSFLKQINTYNIYYIYGNHCDWLRKDAVAQSYFKWVGDYLEIVINKKLLILSHYPFAVWRESHKGSYMLHSHSHGSYKPGLPNSEDSKILDIGWDVFHRPIEFTEITQIMYKKGFKQSDHHNKNTT